jgi:chromosome segregation ATPase
LEVDARHEAAYESAIMTPEPSPFLRAHPSLVLSAYVEPVVRGRRVAVLGDATSGLGEALASRGARPVFVYDPDPGRAAEALARAPRGRPAAVSFARLTDDLGVRDGAFDVVVVPDLSLFESPDDIVRRARRAVSTTGVAVVCSPNAGASKRLLGPVASASPPLDYYALFDLLSLQFPVVRMAGQAPFVGYTVAEFTDEGDLDVTVDTSLLEATEEPEYFLAIGSDRPASLERFTVIELPLGALPSPAAPEPEADLVALAELRARLSLVSLELEKARDRERDGARESAARVGAAEQMSARLAELEQELEAGAARLRDTEARAGDEHVRAERLGHDLRDLDEEVRRQRERAARLSKQLDDEKKARTKADLELGMIRSKPEIAGAKDRLETVAADLDAARARVRELEEAVERAERAEQAAGARLAAAEAEADRGRAEVASLREVEAAMTRRIVEVEQGLRAAEREALELAAQRFAATERTKEVEHRVAALERENSELAGARAELGRRLADADRAAEESLGREVDALERTLRERGETIAALKRELAESDRIGKELVDELEGLRAGGEAAAGADAAAAGASADEALALRSRLDTLATSSARCEADLQAAQWRVAELERRLAEGAGGGASASSAEHELEQALVAAHQEIAALRKALAQEERASGRAAQSVSEQGLLLQQVVGSRP